MNGDLTRTGIERRKKEALKDFLDKLEPSDKSKEQTRTIKKRPRIKLDDDKTESPTQSKIKIKYDPNAPILTSNEEIKVSEPPYFKRDFDKLSTKDSHIGIKTTVKMDDISILQGDKNTARVFASLNGIKGEIIFPESFFHAGNRKIDPHQLIDYLTTIKSYLSTTDNNIYMSFICHSNEIEKTIKLYVYDPDWVSFYETQTKRSFDKLAELIAAIVSKVII